MGRRLAGPLTAPVVALASARRRPDVSNTRDRTWYRIANAVSAERAEVWIYDEIGCWGVTASDFVNDLRAVTARAIDLRLNSPGGEVFDGIAIYNALLSHPAEVTVHVDGLAASAASFIAQAGDSVLMARNAQMMIHDAQGMCFGSASDMRELAGLLDKVSDNIADVYATRAGGAAADWREIMRAERWYSAQEAVGAGLADEVVDVGQRNQAPVSMHGGDRGPAPVSPAAVEPVPIARCVVCAATDGLTTSGRTGNSVCRDAAACIARDEAATDAQLAQLWREFSDELIKTSPPSTVDSVLASLREAMQ